MRRHVKAPSARSKERKPSGLGSSSPSGRLRLTLLLATAAAFLLVPIAQAAAEQNHGPATGQFVTVTGSGTGSGEVTSVEGLGRIGFTPGYNEGDPPIECSYASPGPATGVCESEMEDPNEVPEQAAIFLQAIPAPGFEFAGWTVTQGEALFGCPASGTEEFGPYCLVGSEFGEDAKVTAIFVLEGEGGGGPTNRVPLTVTKSAGGTGGIGSVTSKPKGINCASACNSAVASMYKNTPVTLSAKASTGSTFVEWTGACSGAATTCTVPMAEAESVQAVFGGTSKAIANPQPLTLSKGESSGYGTVKAAGLTCEVECSEVTVLYQGPTGIAPKNKPGKAVELKATPAFGSTFSGWSGAGCSGTGTCIVTMEEAEEVTAEFSAKPTATLTVNKGGTGTGGVSSKPKAINCGTTCTTQDATVPTEAEVVLKEKPGTGMTFTGWSGGGCSGAAETCTVSLSEATTVTASFSGTPKPILNQQELTLTKAGSGYGTIKAAGLTCEVLCTSTVSLYQGPTGIAPKNKPGKTVILKATSAPGSKTVEWTGCLSNPTPTECSVVMEEAEEVTATFDEVE